MMQKYLETSTTYGLLAAVKHTITIFCNFVKIMLEKLTKVPRDEDVIDTGLASGVIMWVVW